MKNLILLVLLCISTGVLSQETFTVFGTLRNTDSLTTIQVFEEDSLGRWTPTTVMVVDSFYMFTCNIDSHYLLQFDNKNGNKLLWLDLIDLPGRYIMDANFEYTTHGVVRYDTQLQEYTSYTVTAEMVKELFDNH